MTFARYAYVLTCLCDPRGAASIAASTENSAASFPERARQAGLTEGDGDGFCAWIQASRLNAAAYDYLFAQEGGGTPVRVDRYVG